MKITDLGIERYLMALGREDDPLLERMEARAREMDFPIVDRLVGRLIAFLTRLKRPELVVELGSGFGYSAYWFARAMERGTVVLTDRSSGHLSFAREVFEDGGLTRRAVFHEGDALRTAQRYEGIDILFIDIDKKDYRHAAESLLGNLAPHGMIIADNALWYGRVLDDAPDEDTRGIMSFNDFMASRDDFHTTILPLRDGVLLGQKLL